MLVYRIVRDKYSYDLSGEGAKLYGGRWNPLSTPVLYTAESKSLGVLELLVHLSNHKIPTTFKIVHINIPFDTLSEIPIVAELPIDWRKIPGPNELQRIGKKQLIDNNKLAIRVPSIILPSEYNVVLNPKHIKFAKVKIVEIEDFKLDKRLKG